MILKLARLMDGDTQGAPEAQSWDQVVSALKPGDIILTKPSDESYNTKTRSDPFLMALAPLVKVVDHGAWVHAALYAGKGKVIHAKRGLETDADRSAQTREQNVDVFRDAMDDLIVLRPRVPSSERKAAVQRARSTLGTPYNAWDIVRAGLAPEHVEGPEEWPDKAICTAVPAYAYPQIAWRPGISLRHTRPNDFIRSPLTQHVIAYTPDRQRLNKVAKLLIERSRNGPTARYPEAE